MTMASTDGPAISALSRRTYRMFLCPADRCQQYREKSVESRLLIAFGLIAVCAVGGSIFAWVTLKRRASRRRRLRGIKDYNSGR